MSGDADTLARIMAKFDNLTNFEYPENIPYIPNVNNEFYYNNILPNLLRCGAIPKNHLVKNTMYRGSSKYATEALWKGEYFIYLYEKWGSKQIKKVNHFENYNGNDIFIPIEEIL